MKTIRDTWLIYRRSLILTLRQPVWVAMGLFQPILYLFLFAPLLEGATSNAGATGSAFNWFIPGLLILTAFFAAAFAGFGLVAEIRYGVVERMRVTPMSRFAMLAGRSLRDVTILLAQSTLLILIAIPFGLEVVPVGAVLTLGIVALVGLTFSLLSYTLGLIFKSEDALAPVAQAVSLPLLLLSGIMLPMALAPDWLQTLSTLNPLTHAVDAARALFNGLWDDPQIVVGSVVMGTLAVALAVGRLARIRPDQRLIRGSIPPSPHEAARSSSGPPFHVPCTYNRPMSDRPIKVLIAKPGLDGHDRGAKVLARGLRDEGFEVVYTGLRQTPEMVATAALQEDVDVVGLSILSGAHMTLVPRITKLLGEQGLGDVLVTVGGIIPDDDIPALKDSGVAEVFGPGTTIAQVAEFLRANARPRD